MNGAERRLINLRTAFAHFRAERRGAASDPAASLLQSRPLTGSVSGHIIVTMTKKRLMPAGRFKAECLAVLDRVAETGEAVIVTKRGRPVAEVVPVRSLKKRPLRGSVSIRGDIVGPVLGDWEVES